MRLGTDGLHPARGARQCLVSSSSMAWEPATAGSVVLDVDATEPDSLLGRRAITKQQAPGGGQYALLREAEVGARWHNANWVGSTDPITKGWPVYDQVQATTALRRVHAIIGLRGRVVLELLAVDNLSVLRIGTRLGRTDRRTGQRVPANYTAIMGELGGVLTRLVELWGLDRADT